MPGRSPDSSVESSFSNPGQKTSKLHCVILVLPYTLGCRDRPRALPGPEPCKSRPGHEKARMHCVILHLQFQTFWPSKRRFSIVLGVSRRPFRLAGAPMTQRPGHSCSPAHGVRTGYLWFRRRVHGGRLRDVLTVLHGLPNSLRAPDSDPNPNPNRRSLWLLKL